MPNHVETPGDWPLGVYQIAVTDPVLGGADGPANVMGQALANRATYQRLRNVTPWSADLAASFGYPAGACVRHGASTWRAKADNNVAPGTNPAMWERWGYSESELAAYLRGSLLSPVRCPVTGPAAAPSDASPYTMWQSVAPFNEYWMWMGDAWRVVANRYAAYSGVASIALAANVVTSITSLTAPRAGSIYVRGILSAVNSQNALTLMQAYIQRTRAGVTSTVLDTLSVYATSVGTQYSQARPMARTDALAGDVYTLIANASLAMGASPGNDSSIHLEYLQ